MRRVKTFLLACGIVVLAFSSASAGVGARNLSAPAAQTPGTTYVVQPGDNLSNIAQRAFGNQACWTAIWTANSWIGNPHHIQPGWPLVIPPSCSVGPTTPVPRYHTVQRGETLSGIACRYYYDCNYWRIYEANRNRIPYPNYLQAGWVLYIP
jgi:nucleoid-associated protein YgaU